MTEPNSDTSVSAIVLAAGMGTRMRSSQPKVMHPVAGQPMINHVIDSISSAGVSDITVVTGPDMPSVVAAAAPHDVVTQKVALGTGDAVKCALAKTPAAPGKVAVLFGADPLIRAQTIEQLIERSEQPDQPAVVVLGYQLDDPAAYGRLVVDETGELCAIVEAKEADDKTLAIKLCNSGIMLLDRAHAHELVAQIKNNNTKGEFYLTDVVDIARAQGFKCAHVVGDAEEFIGVDDRADLAQAEAALQKRYRIQALQAGVTLVDPQTVHFAADTRIGEDVVIEPYVVMGRGVTIESGATIRSFSHLEGCHVASGAVIGPYARLRPGAKIGEQAKIGNFVEVKNATFDAGAKANHLSYVGDSHVGAKANIGAGTITCNYDGYNKSRTEIGAGAFIGSNTALVAPVKVGDGAIVGAGSTIARDVNADALAITRAPQKGLDGYAVKYRKTKSDEKKRKAKGN